MTCTGSRLHLRVLNFRFRIEVKITTSNHVPSNWTLFSLNRLIQALMTASQSIVRIIFYASCALSASPTTFTSGASWSICFSPRRTTGWSSTMMILIIPRTSFHMWCFIYCPLRGLGEKPSPSGEDFSMLAVWRITGNPAIPSMISNITLCGSRSTASRFCEVMLQRGCGIWSVRYVKPMMLKLSRVMFLGNTCIYSYRCLRIYR